VFAKIKRIHFVGIGGIGMSGIAEVLLTMGFKVSGSDVKQSAVTDRLQSLGAIIFIGHRAENVAGAEVVVTSSAISKDNPEVQQARSTKIALVQRAEMLAELMRLKYGIAIAGMHGKTTTTSMVAAVLAAGGLDPTVVVGGRVDAMGSNARLGKSQYLVAEADESDRSFLKLSPIISVVTNIDREHMDCYRDMEDVEHTFLDFLDRLPFYGMAVLCLDNDGLRALIPRMTKRVTTYGLRVESDFRIQRLEVKRESSAGNHTPFTRFEVICSGKLLSDFELFVPGDHNMLNATAAVAVGVGLDIPTDAIRSALAGFTGVDRRFQIKGVARGVTVVDDYGHHPTEIRATLAAARQCRYGKVHVLFQPHRFTRTRDLMDEFATAFGDADSLSLLDIYPASEAPIPGITAEALAQRIDSNGHAVKYFGSVPEAISAIAKNAQAGDAILTLGAGNVSQLGPQILDALNAI
jgi:UDP-N-acetylmuramate--alanine ligase